MIWFEQESCSVTRPKTTIASNIIKKQSTYIKLGKSNLSYQEINVEYYMIYDSD